MPIPGPNVPPAHASSGLSLDVHAQLRAGLSSVLSGRQLQQVDRMNSEPHRELGNATARQSVEVGAQFRRKRFATHFGKHNAQLYPMQVA